VSAATFRSRRKSAGNAHFRLGSGGRSGASAKRGDRITFRVRSLTRPEFARGLTQPVRVPSFPVCRKPENAWHAGPRFCRFFVGCDQNITAFGVNSGYGVAERGISTGG